jgi:FkbM family methyltransferase
MMSRFRKAAEKVRATGVLERFIALRDRTLSFSQFGEDVHMASFLDRLKHDRGIVVRPGWIVDVGSFRPIKFSNTYLFYRRGWHCINIDPTPGTKRLFDRVRPKDINLQVAIGPERGRANFYVFDQPSVWNTMDKEAADEAAAKLQIQPKVFSTDVLRLEDVLSHHLGDQPLEMLLVDAEGYDIEILESHDFKRWAPRLILIEVHGIDASTLNTHPVLQYLEERAYHLHSWINPSLLFVRADSTLPQKNHAKSN